MVFSLYFQIILSLSFSFLLHLFNFKKQLHSLFTLLTTTNATENNNNKLNLKFHNRPISSSKPKLSISIPPPPTMQQLMIGCESINEMQVINDSNLTPEIEGDDDCWKRNAKTVEGGVNNNTFPPPLSSLDCNGKPNFVLLPVRENGRLQLKKVSVERSDIMYTNREDGRLRLYLVPDQCNVDLESDQCNIDLEQEEYYNYNEGEEEEEEEEIIKVESELLSEEEEEMVEESRYEEEEDRVREWNNERCRRGCHEQQLVNNIYGSHDNNLLVYGVSIA